MWIIGFFFVVWSVMEHDRAQGTWKVPLLGSIGILFIAIEIIRW